MEEAVKDHSPGQAGTIQSIDRGSVHRICSGQVVLNLATAVKELVENSIDASATNIEIRLKDYGSEQIDIIDNGCGVEKSNFPGLTLKHHTSKLRDFNDLISVDTFGFRGEALSSLCALSKLSIVTCYEKASVGTRLEYDHNGKLISSTLCARQKGTTVSLQQLFYSLPVRHKEFLRNLKKEFNKMVQLLNAYCIISTGVKITCTNQQGKGKKNVIVSTNANETMKENITNIFGAKQVQSLLDVEQYSPSEEVCSEFGVALTDTSNNMFRVSGYISTCEHGQGRSSTDRQFYYVNRRPCDYTKVSRLVNEVYHTYNRHQYPFVVLDISLAKESVDVNVTPDKRQIFVLHEKLLLSTIKTSLIRMFEPKSSLYQINQPSPAEGLMNLFSRSKTVLSPSRSPVKTQRSCPEFYKKSSVSSSLASLKRSFSSAFDKGTSDPKPNELTTANNIKQRKLDNFISRKLHSPENERSPSVAAGGLDLNQIYVVRNERRPNHHSEADNYDSGIYCSQNSTESSVMGTESPSSYCETDSANCHKVISEESHSQMSQEVRGQEVKVYHSSRTSQINHCDMSVDETSRVCCSETQPIVAATDSEPVENVINPDSCSDSAKVSSKNDLATNVKSSLDQNEVLLIEENKHPTVNSKDSVQGREDCLEDQCIDKNVLTIQHVSPTSQSLRQNATDEDEACHEFDKMDSRKKPEMKIVCSLSSIKEKLSSGYAVRKAERQCRGFRAQITPGDNMTAEQELKKEFSKDMFAKMDILGQFNLGFIVAKLGQDLFIIDQHATDEKFNFEQLQKHTVIQSQQLIQPQSLELTAVNETILMDNLDIFLKNGFDFIINEEAPPTQRVKLKSIPVSKNWTFGKDDIEELIFMLSESPGVTCRPSRIRQMFASRACRKSIMIGTALNKTEMRKLVCHMGEIEQPWNCPHGRPTMRHLINLDMLPD